MVSQINFSCVETQRLPGGYFAPRVNGDFEIVDQSRAGGGSYTRGLCQYQGDRYHAVRLADYQVVNGRLRFIRERDPTPFGC
jgi:hypothetical protein